MTPVKYHGGRNYTIDYHQIIDPRYTNPTKTSLSAAETTRTLSLSIVIPLQPYRIPSPTPSLSNPCGMPRHPPGAGGRRLCRPCLGMRPHGILPPASLSLAIATPFNPGRSIPNPRSGGALPYVGRPALGGRMCPLSGAVRAGREPRVGRRGPRVPSPECPGVSALPFARHLFGWRALCR